MNTRAHTQGTLGDLGHQTTMGGATAAGSWVDLNHHD